MNEPHFDAQDKAVQQVLQSTQAPPRPSLSTRQFASQVQARLDAPSISSWKLHFPLALSAAGAMAFFFALQSPKVTLMRDSSSTDIAWNEIDIRENETTQWQTDPFNEESYNEDEDVEALIFADLEISDELTQQYDEGDFETVESLDDEALDRLDQILNDAIKNRGG